MSCNTYLGIFFKLSIITAFLLCELDVAAAACSQPNTRICYRQVSHVTYYTTYSRGSRGTSYRCGWLNSRRCRRTVYYQQSSSTSRVHYTTESVCCNGYTQVNGQCEPSCNPSCEYGYTCVAPNMCRRGVQLMLDGVNYPNNSLIQFDNIYNSSDYCHSLLCTTDRVPCCSVSQGGNWYQLVSNGSHLQLTTVPHTMEEEYYQNMGNDGTLRLLRQNGVRDAPTNSSVYCCQLSDTALSVHTLCVSIVESSPGVWLELDGQLHANNSAIELREVYESPTDSHSLMCVTPKRPCCATQLYHFGEWFYPNQSNILNNGSGNSFYSTKRDDGTVRLHRRGVASLAAAMGQYCCEIPNDTNTTQRLCVHFVDNSPIQVSSSLTGQRYSNNSIIRLSEVYYNEIQSLICATDKRPCCSSQNAWHYQNGSVVPSLSEGYDFYAEGRSDGRVHLYIKNVTVTFVNSIQFCCELPNINNLVQKVCVYLDTTVEVTDIDATVTAISVNKFIEFRIFGIRDCYDWVHQDTLLKEDDLLNAITDGVEKSCQCGFSMTYFAIGGFQCFQDSAERAVTYRTNLRTPNGSIDFAEKISLWLSTGPSIQVAGVLLNVDSMCNLIISSFGDPECGEGTEQEATTETFTLPVTAQSNELHTIIGAGVGFVVMLLVFFCLLVIILVLWKKSKGKSRQYNITQPSNTKETNVDVPISTKPGDETYAEIADVTVGLPGEYYEAVVSSQAGSVTYHKTLPDCMGDYKALSNMDSKSVYTLPKQLR